MTPTRLVSSPSSCVPPIGREPPSPNSRCFLLMVKLSPDGQAMMTRLKILSRASAKRLMSLLERGSPQTLSPLIERVRHQLGGRSTGVHLECPVPSQPVLYRS